jgi:hypothetical protein
MIGVHEPQLLDEVQPYAAPSKFRRGMAEQNIDVPQARRIEFRIDSAERH